MGKLRFEPALCVRAKSKFSQCTQCVDASCGHVAIEEQLPTFAKGTGIEAAACVGACPTEALSLDGFSATAFFFAFLESGDDTLRPSEALPCLSLLSVEHLISLALASEHTLHIDLAAYDDNDSKIAIILSRLEEANFILEAIGAKLIVRSDGKREDDVTNETSDETQDRRAFLRQTVTLEGIAKQKKSFDEAVEAGEMQHFSIDDADIAKLKQHLIPGKRKILFTVLKHAKRPEAYEVLAQEDVSFVSQKYVDESCNNCQICYRICPTGALSSDARFSLIHFDAMLCVKCRLCHDACEPDAIKLQPGFELKEFFEPIQRTLVTFNIKRCEDCGNPFTYFGGEVLCPHCRIFEEEAIELHENARRRQKEREEQENDNA